MLDVPVLIVGGDVPVARPGSRAPHVWLERGGQPVSTVDLFAAGFTLPAGPAGTSWCESARGLARHLGAPLDAFTVGAELADPEDRWAPVYGVDADGAVLVRPDGHVGWRGKSEATDPSAELERALQTILGPAPVEASS